MRVLMFESDSRTSTGSVDDVKTGFDAVTQSGAGRTGASSDQTAARSVFVAAIESETGGRGVPVALIRAVHSAALKVQRIVNPSVASRVGVPEKVRSVLPFESTTARRAPLATLAGASCSVARMVTLTVERLPELSFLAVTVTLSMPAPARSNSAPPNGSLLTL